MRISHPVILASIAAIAVASIFVLTYPHYILNLGIAPTGISVQEFYQSKTILDLPPSIQELQLLIPYLYCFAVNSISAIVIWLHLNDVYGIIA